jgi:hypothetical protein
MRLSANQMRALKNDTMVWAFFEAQAPSYRTTVRWRVTGAKQLATRYLRFAGLLQGCKKELRL